VPLCANGKPEANCDVTVLDKFTTSFNFPQQNFAAIWMRPFWSLVINSFISDVQNAGVNFVTSGDFSKASVIEGFWSLLRKSALVGSTQWLNPKSDLKDNPLASNAGPVNPFKSSAGVTGLTCAPEPGGAIDNPAFCLPIDSDKTSEGVVFLQSNWGVSQRFFSVYDGPTYQDSNAYLNILPTYLTSDGTVKGSLLGSCKPSTIDGNPCSNKGFMNSFLPGVKADQLNGRCYLPNAAIGWKQPNGFYYAPAFHSTNLFFDNVGIRHLVTEPFFSPGLFSFDTDLGETKKHYCYWNPVLFNGFTDIDRETVLNDDDGTLTGLTSPVNSPDIPKTETISVNTEKFFNAPTETIECASDLALNTAGPAKTGDPRCAPATAKTSPYEYVTTSLYPECALDVPVPPPPAPKVLKCTPNNVYIWGSACSDSPPTDGGCIGIPMFRQLLLNNGEKQGLDQVKRMMGQNTFQRSALTANNGVYYIDTTVSKKTQDSKNAQSINVFTAGQKYDIFFLYANEKTTQTYQLFVGKQIPPTGGKDFGQTNVKFGYVDITDTKYKFGLATPPKKKNPGDLPDGWSSNYNSGSGILTLTTNMKSLADDFDITKNDLGKNRCQPASMCTWDSNANTCGCNSKSPYFKSCNETSSNIGTVCSWSVKDIDCPDKGCPAFQVTFPSDKYFVASDQKVRPMPANYNFGGGFNWDIGFNLENSDISGKECNYTTQPPLACKNALGGRRRHHR
jgi:cell migration-inducing and hyaluronan-binding protein